MILYFNRKVKPFYSYRQGIQMLVAALIFELVRTVLTLTLKNEWADTLLSTGALGLILLVSVFATTRYVLHIDFKQIGLKRWRYWNHYEKSYLPVIALLGIIIFYLFRKSAFHQALQEKEWWLFPISFLFYLCWGFYQEWIYRGFIQTELTRRWQPAKAILLANFIYTFGPLHFYQLYQGAYIIVAATFIIGLLFGIIYHRSYNLCIVGTLHGIGNWFLVGLKSFA